MSEILSYLSRTMPGVHAPNPWQRAWDDWSHVQIVHLPIPELDVKAKTRWLRGEPVGIILSRDLSQRERRCHLAHELEHLDRGQPCGTLRAIIEQRVINDTARYLLPDLKQLAETIAIYDIRRAAWELNVTFGVLRDRLNALSDEESRYVHARHQCREDIA